jgi:hypothetical protein
MWINALRFAKTLGIYGLVLLIYIEVLTPGSSSPLLQILRLFGVFIGYSIAGRSKSSRDYRIELSVSSIIATTPSAPGIRESADFAGDVSLRI